MEIKKEDFAMVRIIGANLETVKGYRGIMKNLGRINFLAFENCCEIQMRYLRKDIHWAKNY